MAHLLLGHRKWYLTLTIWPGMILTLLWPWPHLWPWPWTTQTKLNCCPGSKINISDEMTLTLTQWPDTHSWHRYGQDAIPYQKWSFYVNSFKSYSWTDTQTDTHRHTDTTKTTSAGSSKDELKQPHLCGSLDYVLHVVLILVICW